VVCGSEGVVAWLLEVLEDASSVAAIVVTVGEICAVTELTTLVTPTSELTVVPELNKTTGEPSDTGDWETVSTVSEVIATTVNIVDTACSVSEDTTGAEDDVAVGERVGRAVSTLVALAWIDCDSLVPTALLDSRLIENVVDGVNDALVLRSKDGLRDVLLDVLICMVLDVSCNEIAADEVIIPTSLEPRALVLSSSTTLLLAMTILPMPELEPNTEGCICAPLVTDVTAGLGVLVATAELELESAINISDVTAMDMLSAKLLELDCTLTTLVWEVAMIVGVLAG
jgi:hypothetical protein